MEGYLSHHHRQRLRGGCADIPEFNRSGARLASAERNLNSGDRELLYRDAEIAEENFAGRARRSTAPNAKQTDAQIDVETERGTLEVDLSAPLMSLTRRLCRADTVAVAGEIVQTADAELNSWEISRRSEVRQAREIVMPFGVELRVPAEFEPRR